MSYVHGGKDGIFLLGGSVRPMLGPMHGGVRPTGWPKAGRVAVGRGSAAGSAPPPFMEQFRPAATMAPRAAWVVAMATGGKPRPGPGSGQASGLGRGRAVQAAVCTGRNSI